MSNNKSLSPKQKVFVREYLKDHNATQSAIRAGYSERSSTVTSCRLLANANVSAAIKKAEEKAWDKAIMSRREALSRLSAMGRSNMADYIDESGKLDIDKILEEKPVLSEFHTKESDTQFGSSVSKRAKLVCPDRAIAELSKMQGFYEPEKHEHTVTPEDEALEHALEKKLDSMSVDELSALLEKMESK